MRLLALCIFAMTLVSCCVPQQYDEVCIMSGEVIVKQLTEYVESDSGLSDKEKAVIKDSCNEFIMLLKQE